MNSGLSLAFRLVVHQPCDARTNTYPWLCSPFLFYGIGTRADANIHKVISYKYLSNNNSTVVGEWHHGYFWEGWLGRRGGSVFWFLCKIVTLMPEAALVSLRTLAFFFFWWQVPPSTPLIPFRFLTTAPDSILPCLASKFKQSKFLIYTSLHHGFQLLIVGNRYLLLILHVVQFHYGFELRGTDFPRYHRMESLTRIVELHSHLASNSWTLWSRRVTENKSAWSNTVSWAPVTRKLSKIMKAICFFSGTDPLLGLSAPRGWPSSWNGNSGWSCSEQKQSSRLASRNSKKSFQFAGLEDFSSPKEWTFSTSLVHHIAFDGKN